MCTKPCAPVCCVHREGCVLHEIRNINSQSRIWSTSSAEMDAIITAGSGQGQLLIGGIQVGAIQCFILYFLNHFVHVSMLVFLVLFYLWLPLY